MIIKYFNLDWEYIEHHLPVWDFYCMMAISLERDDIDRYWDAMLSGNIDMKKYPNPFKPQMSRDRGIMPILEHFKINPKSVKPSGSPLMYAKATGRPIAYYQRETDAFYDKDGNKIEFDPAVMVGVQLPRGATFPIGDS